MLLPCGWYVPHLHLRLGVSSAVAFPSVLDAFSVEVWDQVVRELRDGRLPGVVVRVFCESLGCETSFSAESIVCIPDPYGRTRQQPRTDWRARCDGVRWRGKTGKDFHRETRKQRTRGIGDDGEGDHCRLYCLSGNATSTQVVLVVLIGGTHGKCMVVDKGLGRPLGGLRHRSTKMTETLVTGKEGSLCVTNGQ